MKIRKTLKILPFFIVFMIICILWLTKILNVDPILADESISTKQSTNQLELIPFFWTVGIVGGFIGLTLAYVSWRKYKAEKKKTIEKEKQKSHVNHL